MPDWQVDPRKILDYLLNEASPTGAAKARFFRAGGYQRGYWMELAEALCAHPTTASLQEIDAGSPYGEKRVFRCRIAMPDGRAPCIRTVWQRRDGVYWLVTASPFD